MSGPAIAVTLDAVVLAVTDGIPRVLLVDDGASPALPSGPLDVDRDVTLERGLRRYVAEQTDLQLGYVEQLYTFGDRDRAPDAERVRRLSVGYLALVRETTPTTGVRWADVYGLLPWEDMRDGRPHADEALQAALADWADTTDAAETANATDATEPAAGVEEPTRAERISLTFGPPWDGIRALERYELLYDTGLVAEHAIDRGTDHPGIGHGTPLRADHRRILATALGRIRGKLTYRPVVFELLAEPFTLLELQRTVEALAGIDLHKQNFRRQVLATGLVEGTGETRHAGSGRPAQLFRYRPEVQLERPRPGLGQPYR